MGILSMNLINNRMFSIDLYFSVEIVSHIIHGYSLFFVRPGLSLHTWELIPWIASDYLAKIRVSDLGGKMKSLKEICPHNPCAGLSRNWILSSEHRFYDRVCTLFNASSGTK